MVLAGDMTTYFNLACAVVSGFCAIVSVVFAYWQNLPFAFIRANKLWISNPRAKAIKVRSVTYQGVPAKMQNGFDRGIPTYAEECQFSIMANEVCYPGETEPICSNILFADDAEYQIKMTRTRNGNVFDVKVSTKITSLQSNPATS